MVESLAISFPSQFESMIDDISANGEEWKKVCYLPLTCTNIIDNKVGVHFGPKKTSEILME